MRKIKSNLNLRNETEFLHEIKEDSPAYLQLLKELEVGEKSAKENKWLTADEAEEMLGL